MRYTKEEKKILREAFMQGGWKSAQCALQAAGYRRSRHSIIKKAHKLGLRDYSHWWSEEEILILKEAYPIGGKILATKALHQNGFNRTVEAVKGKATVLRLNAHNNGQFKKGIIPANKGKGMTEEQKKKVSRTWFPKGHKPKNTLHNGAITIRISKSGKPYKHIRTAPKVWRLYHRFLWEQCHGPISKGMVIYFKDGDTLNCSIDNLATRSRNDHLQSNIQRSGGRPCHILSDGYVGGVLKRLGIPPEAITREMIELKRAELLLKREIKKHECHS